MEDQQTTTRQTTGGKESGRASSSLKEPSWNRGKSKEDGSSRREPSCNGSSPTGGTKASSSIEPSWTNSLEEATCNIPTGSLGDQANETDETSASTKEAAKKQTAKIMRRKTKEERAMAAKTEAAKPLS